MDGTTKALTRTEIVSHSSEDLTRIVGERFRLPARFRALGDPAEFEARIVAHAANFLFECEYPRGAVIESTGGGGLEAYSLYVPLRGALMLDYPSGRVLCTPTTAGFGESFTFDRKVFSANSRTNFVAVPRAEVTRHLSDLIERPVHGSLEFAQTVDLTAGVGPTIGGVAGALRAGLSGAAPLLESPIAMQRMKEAMIALMLEGIPHRFSAELRRPVGAASPYYVKRAIEYMWANAARPLSAAEIAAECGVSVRALSSGFRAFKEIPMMAYLREIRLNAVRQELRNPETVASIAAVAQAWGFTHFGRFSSEYEKRFGELPSQTRRRTVGAGPGAL